MARSARRRTALARRRRRAPRRNPDSQRLAGIKQGVGRAVARAFGSAPVRRRRRGGRGKRGMTTGYHPCLMDAFHHGHLPLPRPTGPYTVIRTTQLIATDDPLMIFGPTVGDDGYWTNTIAYGIKDVNSTIATANNTYQYTMVNMKTASWNAAQLVPAAFSVQLMNPQAIQSTNGIVYAGRLRTEWKIAEAPNRGSTGLAVANQFISYNNPRLLSAAKLAFRGVQTDCVPFNMSYLANFTTQDQFDPQAITVSATTPNQRGFGPQFYYNPNKISLQYLVCVEWRVRFDPANPAQAAHVQYNHADESVWMRCLHAAEAMGNGVIDIADKVAETGNAVFGAAAGAYRASRGMRALTAGVGQLALGA